MTEYDFPDGFEFGREANCECVRCNAVTKTRKNYIQVRAKLKAPFICPQCLYANFYDFQTDVPMMIHYCERNYVGFAIRDYPGIAFFPDGYVEQLSAEQLEDGFRKYQAAFRCEEINPKFKKGLVWMMLHNLWVSSNFIDPVYMPPKKVQLMGLVRVITSTKNRHGIAISVTYADCAMELYEGYDDIFYFIYSIFLKRYDFAPDIPDQETQKSFFQNSKILFKGDKPFLATVVTTASHSKTLKIRTLRRLDNRCMQVLQVDSTLQLSQLSSLADTEGVKEAGRLQNIEKEYTTFACTKEIISSFLDFKFVNRDSFKPWKNVNYDQAKAVLDTFTALKTNKCAMPSKSRL